MNTANSIQTGSVRKSVRKKRETGFTLIELLVAMAIALVVLAAAVSLFKTSSSQHHAVTNKAQMQEESFFVSHVLKQQIAQIGYRSVDESKVDGRIMPIEDKETAFPEVPNMWASGQTFSLTNTTLSYRFFGASAADLSADASIYDCLGNPIPDGLVQQNQISLQDNQLICNTDTGQGVILGDANGVLVEQIAYEIGIDDDGDRIVDRIIDGSTASDAEFSQAKLLTVRLLLATPDGVTNDQRSYFFNGTEFTANDRKLRLESEVSLALRN